MPRQHHWWTGIERMLPFLHGIMETLPVFIHSEFLQRCFRRKQSELAKLIHCLPEEIVFTSSGPNQIMQPLKALHWESFKRKSYHCIFIEHDCVLNACKCSKTRVSLSLSAVDSFGIVDIDRLKNILIRKRYLYRNACQQWIGLFNLLKK